jgi:hypothetical protein
MRIAQQDLLDFCLDPDYAQKLEWPAGYWPTAPAPPDSSAWDKSVAAFRADRERLKQLVSDAGIDLVATVPTGHGKQTFLRAILLVADHNAYHLGQLVAVRRALGAWAA